MNIFTWLIVGHLVGDWLLQNDWMAKHKQRALFTLPGMTHFFLYTAIVTLTLWFSDQVALDSKQYLLFILIIFITHWFVDALNIAAYWVRLFRQSDDLFVRLMVDQTLHILILALVIEWLL